MALLNAGYRVRGTLRDLSRVDEVRAAVAPHIDDTKALNHLSFVELDLTADAGWEGAMDGIDVLMHTASPFPMVQPADEDDLIRPAVEGTLRALKAAYEAGIKRAIVTSSTAAISGGPLPAEKKAYDEDCWTDVASPAVSAYSKSKTLAERAAWEFVGSSACDMELTTINPGFVVGAPLDENYGTSTAVIARILRAKDPANPRIGFTSVDVRDVADLHLAALRQPATAGQRIMCVSEFLWFSDIAKAIKMANPNRKITTREAPDFLVRLLSLFDPAIKGILPQLGEKIDTNNARARSTLGREMRDVLASCVETAQYLLEKSAF